MNQTANSTLKKVVWVVSDGIPGHFNQSKGIILALEHLYNLELHWIELKLKKTLPKQILALMLNYNLLPLGLFTLAYQGQLPVQKPDIVVGAGGRSSFAVAWLGKIYQAKTIFSGSLRQLKAGLFSVVLNLEESGEPNILTVPVAPAPITQQKLQQAAHEWRLQYPQVQGKFWAMLIGGDGAGAAYQSNDWQTLAVQMNQIAQQQGIRWLVTTSRRTGKESEKILEQYLHKDVIADAVWWGQDPRPVTSAYLGLSEVVCCTIDSMSMIMESISAMRPVLAVKPAVFNADQRFLQAIDALANQGFLQLGSIKQLQDFSSKHLQLKPLAVEPSIQLAEKLKNYL